MYICIFNYICMKIYIYKYVLSSTRVPCVGIYLNKPICLYVHTLIYAYTYSNTINIYMHTHMYI